MKSVQLKLSPESLCALAALALLMLANNAFWARLASVLGAPGFANLRTYASIFLLLWALLTFLLLLIAARAWLKPVLCSVFLLAAAAAYFMDHYGVVIDRHALQSTLETDARESIEWLSWGMLWPLSKVFVAPCLLILYLVDTAHRSIFSGLKRRAFVGVGCIFLVALMIATNYQAFASVARNHAVLRDLFNPFNVLNAVRSYVQKNSKKIPEQPIQIAADAKRRASSGRPQLLVIVVGESLRIQSFGRLSSGRNTTPSLEQLPVNVFDKVSSCGTNTATSVPCMFSNLTRAGYDDWRAKATENLLDIYQNVGLKVEWIDNNTGSKNVARRVLERDVSRRSYSEFCDADGCHDEILIAELRAALPKVTADSVLVLHMLGSHGPAYYQRYPKQFARFQPVCESVELQNCTPEALNNSYENSVLYTDFVLAEMLKTLQLNSAIDATLFFVSDHGESTGEGGFFLHGAPYAIAPTEQTRVPMLIWFSESFGKARKLSADCVAREVHAETSHDAVFPMLLRLMDIQTNAYRAELDPLAACYAISD